MLATTLLLLMITGDTPAQWWSTYGDPQLTALIERALANNLDLRQAAERIAEARAVTGQSRAALMPSVDATASAQNLRGGFQQGVARIPRTDGDQPGGTFVAPFQTPVYQGGFDMKWELDFWGANRQRVSAAKADFAAELERRRDLEVSVSAEVARAYVELRGLEDRIAITERLQAAQQSLLDLTKVRAQAGLASQLDVERQAALLSNTAALLPPLIGDRALRVHRLAVLTGDRQLAVSSAAAGLTTPSLDGPIDSTLLKRRPDVRAAEARISAEQARLKVARTDLYPKVTLSGLMGRQSTSVGGLTLGGGNFFSLGPQLQLPIFTGGRIRSSIAAQDARLSQARTRYEQDLLIAFEEAENALSLYQQQKARSVQLEETVAASQRVLDLANDVYRAGLNDFLSVLDAQRELLNAQDARAVSRTQTLAQSVALFKALGGGWPQ